jgi:RNA polymerase sigma-70 factor (family 1)
MALRIAEDSTLLARIQNDDEQAFDHLFTKYYSGLLRYCKMLLPYPTDQAEEILLDVFFKMWQQRKEINVHTSLASLLYTSVKNRTYDYYRKTNNGKYEEVEAAEDHPEAYYLIPDQQLSFKELSNNIEQLIAQLPDRTQMVFRMNRQDALPYQEIADLLNISVNSVKTHMYRAIKFLKKAFHDSNAFGSY